MEIRQSATRTIRRSQINLNPVNPKRHTAEALNLQKKNLRKVGFLGGVVWNERTGNLVDGHRRVLALDQLNKFDGTPGTDYELKVEVVNFDDKTEKEQMTYMAVGDTQADLDLIAEYIREIDYTEIGLDEKSIDEVLAMAPSDDLPDGEIDDLLPDIADVDAQPSIFNEDRRETATPGQPAETTKEERIAAVKEAKQRAQEHVASTQADKDAYVVLSFSDNEAYLQFCDMAGIKEGERYVKGEDILALFE